MPARQLLLSLAALLPLATGAAAHGSIFAPPPTTEGDSGGARIGGARGPRTPGAGRSGAPGATTRGSGPAGMPAAPRPAGPSSGAALNDDRTDWQWWWEFNKEPFLLRPEHLGAERAQSGGDGFFLGRGARAARRADPHRLAPVVLRDRVLPALRRALEEGDSNDMVTSCLIAIARIGNDLPASERGALSAVLVPHLRDSNRDLAEAAVLSLGLLGHEPNVQLLGDLLLDTEAGRVAVAGEGVPQRLRAFAAYGLALLGRTSERIEVRRFVVHRLARGLETMESSDVGVACALALGHVPLPWAGTEVDGTRPRGREPEPVSAGRESQVRLLLSWTIDEDRPRLPRAHAVSSLGRLVSTPDAADHAPAVAPAREAVIEVLQRRGVPREVRQSCAIALGHITDGDGDPHDVAARNLLLEVATDTADLGTRQFATIALGRAAGRPGTGPAADLGELRRTLHERSFRVGSREGRWSALALALLERGRLAARRQPDPAAAAVLRAGVIAAGAPDDAAAFSIAAGILGHGDAVEPVADQLERQGPDVTRGHLALAMGLFDDPRAVPPLHLLLQEPGYRPWALRGAALALGRLGDPRVVELLLARLRSTDSLSAQASLAHALGRIGDGRTLEPLLGLLEDSELTPGARAFAAAALGLVADEDALPWNAPLSVDVNFLAAPPTLYDDRGRGLLNIL